MGSAAGRAARRLSLVGCVLLAWSGAAVNQITERRSARTLGRLAVLIIAVGGLAGIGVGAVAYLLVGERTHDGLGLPPFHGQVSWPAGERRAPPFELRDHNGDLVSLGALRGRSVVLTFLDSRCEEQCPLEGQQLGITLRGMAPTDRPTLVIVSVDPAGDTPASIREAMASWRLAGSWRWHWLRGTKSELERVWRDYGITVEPATKDITHGLALYLIDRRGFERTGYLFPFLPNFVALDLRSLARERG
jgi:protein SCO1/2